MPLTLSQRQETAVEFFWTEQSLLYINFARRLLFAILVEDDSLEEDVINAVCSKQQMEEGRPCIPRRMMNTSQHTGEVWANSILTGHEKRCYNVFARVVRLGGPAVGPKVLTGLAAVNATEACAAF
ncbi:hypothetical protein Taro_020590 [Colocasia esculenta]|uniref:Uncharacterized protein n=1 Tax=Colocasia esculenta TaxID=4460 RepID=A0A843UZ62_COLES|nr:hypothetical protein [Colocasia esculenta]